MRGGESGRKLGEEWSCGEKAIGFAEEMLDKEGIE